MTGMSGWPNRVLLIGLLNIALALPICATDNGQAQGWQQGLQEVRRLADEGRYHTALSEIQRLQADYPNVGALQLEAALIHLAVDDFTAARDNLARVLDRDDLPEAVRINALLLGNTIDQRAETHSRPRWQAEVSANSGLTARDQQSWVGAEVWLQREQALANLNAGGFPARLRTRLSLDAGFRHYGEGLRPARTYSVRGLGGLVTRWRAWSIDASLGGYHNERTRGPMIDGGTRLALSESMTVFGRHTRFFRSDDSGGTATDHLVRAGVNISPHSDWQLDGEWRRWSGTDFDAGVHSLHGRLTRSFPQSRLTSVALGLTVPLQDSAPGNDMDLRLRWASQGWRPGWDGRLQVPLEGDSPGGQLGLFWRY
ncbi:MAG: hypothetical protein LAT62_09195 [Natronospirillum sp.]|uniref:hypothetical protein n=1 Tax=Natronospirillum sp. TaxID=2812955 RepID=UPI0025EA2290|nr:hypothetical protein [Natronospirillum sp.]MCH8552099.1 hypothetical protein [Natronospirillum sp.]